MDSYAQELSQYYYGVAKQRCRATLRFSSFAKKNKGERKEEKHECFHKSGNLPHCEKIRKDLFRIKKCVIHEEEENSVKDKDFSNQ